MTELVNKIDVVRSTFDRIQAVMDGRTKRVYLSKDDIKTMLDLGKLSSIELDKAKDRVSYTPYQNKLNKGVRYQLSKRALNEPLVVKRFGQTTKKWLDLSMIRYQANYDDQSNCTWIYNTGFITPLELYNRIMEYRNYMIERRRVKDIYKYSIFIPERYTMTNKELFDELEQISESNDYIHFGMEMNEKQGASPIITVIIMMPRK